MTGRRYGIAIRGAGIVGLWQALTLARRGHAVTLYERSTEPFSGSCSLYAGAMLAPRCEEESADPIVRQLGERGIALWKGTYPGTVAKGSLVVAAPREKVLLDRFGRMTKGSERLEAGALAAREPDLAERFACALFYPGEASLDPMATLAFLLEAAQAAGATLKLGHAGVPTGADIVIDCRGLAARDELPSLRGVRGERIILRAPEIALATPVRLLHPRFPLYVVPWGDGRFMVGATAIESDDAGPVSVRSTLELLSAAYAVDPAFGEAEIINLGAGVRPAFPDNRPRILTAKGYIYVNGLYRHGFLLAPALAALVANYIETDEIDPEVFVANPAQR
ncbi:MAG: FAD-dependent oxidoreductase [Methyloceanibacter sp.]